MAKRRRLLVNDISGLKVDDHDYEEEDGHVALERNKRMQVSIEPDVMECTVCFGPLRPPLFQCKNGHVVCSDCRAKLHNKCHVCAQDLRHSRCITLEKAIESIRVPCAHASHGCKMTIPYFDRIHKETCAHAPIPCPVPDCTVRASAALMKNHLVQNHGIQSVTKPIAGSVFAVEFNEGQKLVALEGMDGVLFLLINSSDEVDHRMALFLVCVLPPSSKDNGSGFNYELKARSPMGTYLSLVGSVACLKSRSDENDVLLVPRKFYQSGRLSLSIEISKKKRFC